ncbi:MAG: FtsQ-type POTRA domain-containing protein [Ruminococcaceae bacterium]|nr:FtsQ-type POTRA domain-containing protein [Oscillospiraceae bacterium]
MTDDKKITDIQNSAKRKVKRQKYFTIFFIVVIVLLFAVIAFANLFHIKQVKVSGISAAVPYSSEDVIKYLNLGEKTNLVTFDTDKAKRSLSYEFPYIEKIEIKKDFPSTLEIIITEDKGTLYLDIGEDTFVLSSGGKVLEITSDPFYDGKSRTELLVNGVKRCVCGESLVFARDDMFDILVSITEQLEKYDLSEKITKLDIRDKFDVRLMYDNRFEIKFGTFENAENKMKLFSEMIKNKIWEDSTGVIDISDGTKALVKFTGNVAN